MFGAYALYKYEGLKCTRKNTEAGAFFNDKKHSASLKQECFFHIKILQCSLIADPNDYFQSSFYVAAYQFGIIIHIVKRVAFYPNMKRLLVVTMKLRYEREFDSCVAVVVDFNRWWIVPSQVESRLVSSATLYFPTCVKR